MKKIGFLLLAILSLFGSNLFAEEILILPIQGVIDLGLSTFVKRAIKDAEAQNISTIILEMDTPGGRVDAADIICEALLEFKGKTVTFILNQAWSAGSMISFATDEIIMRPASSIGSAEPRMGLSNQEIKDEKIVSALRARFKAIAEEKNHNPALAQAMVDKDLVVKQVLVKNKEFILTQQDMDEIMARKGKRNIKIISVISEEGKLLNLTAKDSQKYGLSKAICQDRETMLAYLEKEGAKLIEKSPTWSENIVRLITHPVASSLLLGIGFWAIILALRIPGLGLPEIVGVSFILLFFWGHKLAGLAQWLDLFLIMIGVILIFIEIFVLPGFGITGGLGITCLLGGIILIMVRHPIYPPIQELNNAGKILFSSFIITAILFLMSFKFLSKSKAWKNIVLEHRSEAKLEPQEVTEDSGVAISDLHPAGKAQFGNKIYDVQTDGEYIDSGKKIKIISHFGNIIKVRQS
ncbi:MAG: NfeD family protein [Candidatus Saelkia tenebricola]|nr:NfeD family protein [Candidatus Saelkia tenebricola]